jgi:hypothetical protein
MPSARGRPPPGSAAGRRPRAAGSRPSRRTRTSPRGRRNRATAPPTRPYPTRRPPRARTGRSCHPSASARARPEPPRRSRAPRTTRGADTPGRSARSACRTATGGAGPAGRRPPPDGRRRPAAPSRRASGTPRRAPPEPRQGRAPFPEPPSAAPPVSSESKLSPKRRPTSRLRPSGATPSSRPSTTSRAYTLTRLKPATSSHIPSSGMSHPEICSRVARRTNATSGRHATRREPPLLLSTSGRLTGTEQAPAVDDPRACRRGKSPRLLSLAEQERADGDGGQLLLVRSASDTRPSPGGCFRRNSTCGALRPVFPGFCLVRCDHELWQAALSQGAGGAAGGTPIAPA